MLDRQTIETTLQHFHGTDGYTRAGFMNSVLMSDGVSFLAEAAGCYWLIDAISIAQRTVRKVRAEEFQVWELTVADSKATLVCTDGNENAVYRQHIPFTDFPLPTLKLFFSNGVVYLPQEH